MADQNFHIPKRIEMDTIAAVLAGTVLIEPKSIKAVGRALVLTGQETGGARLVVEPQRSGLEQMMVSQQSRPRPPSSGRLRSAFSKQA